MLAICRYTVLPNLHKFIPNMSAYWIENVIHSEPCRACRFQKCLDLGMNTQFVQKISTQQLITQGHIDSEFLRKLKNLDDTRREVYKIININDDSTFNDLVLQESRLSCYRKPVSLVQKAFDRQPNIFQNNVDWRNSIRKVKPWGYLGILLAVETIKSLDFYKDLLLSDRVRFTALYNYRYIFSVFCWNQSHWKRPICLPRTIHIVREKAKSWHPLAWRCFQMSWIRCQCVAN